MISPRDRCESPVLVDARGHRRVLNLLRKSRAFAGVPCTYTGNGLGTRNVFVKDVGEICSIDLKCFILCVLTNIGKKV